MLQQPTPSKTLYHRYFKHKHTNGQSNLDREMAFIEDHKNHVLVCDRRGGTLLLADLLK